MESGVASQRRVTAAVASDLEASVHRRELLQQVPQLVSDLVSSKPLLGVPRQFSFHPDNRRLYFLADTKATDLHYVDIPLQESLDIPSPLEWRTVLAKDVDQGKSNQALSKEEQLRRERQRAAAFGLSTYAYHDGKRKFLLPAANSIYIVDGEDVAPQPKELASNFSGSRIDPKFSPSANMVSFVRNNDLWVQDVATGAELRLTHSNPDDSPNCKRGSGIAEYIMQEEFDRYTGYYWDPSSVGKTNRIVFAEIDESHLRVFKIPEPGIEGNVDDFTYPMAGDENARFDIAFVEFDSNDLQKASPVVKRLKPSLKERFPWCEYMPRFGWTPDGEKIWIQLLDRKQQRYSLVTIDVDQFVADGVPPSAADAQAGVTVLREEKTSYWINITDLLYFFKDGSGRVLVASEETLFRHLYLLTPQNGGKSYSSRAVTVGDGWQVDDSLLRVDEARGFVYFMGTKDSPLEAHLYAASLSSDADPYYVTRLTPSGFKHSVQMSPDLTQFVSCFSNINESHRTQIYTLNHAVREGRPAFPTSSLRATFAKASVLSRKPLKFGINPPELFSFKNSHDETVHGCFFKPRNFDPSRKYPAVLFVYAGPHVQYVTNDYTMNHMFMALHMYAHLGFIGIVVDGVGSWRRGLKFEGYLREKMGTIEVQEQVQGVEYLIKKGFVDPERVAVRGWSYGGYMSLLCLSQRPDFFKLAISGAPVTKWEAYDTGYTERYMDTPQNNPTGYQEGSVMHYVNGFPDDPNRLLIIHGAIDENVHFCNSLELIQALIEHDKPYQLLVFPRERHGVRTPSSAQYLETQILRFILSNL